jgi:hypothetical protein
MIKIPICIYFIFNANNLSLCEPNFYELISRKPVNLGSHITQAVKRKLKNRISQIEY